jgi:hypothetical protein
MDYKSWVWCGVRDEKMVASDVPGLDLKAKVDGCEVASRSRAGDRRSCAVRICRTYIAANGQMGEIGKLACQQNRWPRESMSLRGGLA